MDKYADGAADPGIGSDLPEISFEKDDSWRAEPEPVQPIPEHIPQELTREELRKIFPSNTGWAIIHGVEAVAPYLSDAVQQAASRAGLPDTEVQRLTNLAARSIPVEMNAPDLAWGIVYQGRPIVQHATYDRNHALAQITPYLTQIARQRLNDREQADEDDAQFISPKVQVPTLDPTPWKQQRQSSTKRSDVDLLARFDIHQYQAGDKVDVYDRTYQRWIPAIIVSSEPHIKPAQHEAWKPEVMWEVHGAPNAGNKVAWVSDHLLRPSEFPAAPDDLSDIDNHGYDTLEQIESLITHASEQNWQKIAWWEKQGDDWSDLTKRIYDEIHKVYEVRDRELALPKIPFEVGERVRVVPLKAYGNTQEVSGTIANPPATRDCMSCLPDKDGRPDSYFPRSRCQRCQGTGQVPQGPSDEQYWVAYDQPMQTPKGDEVHGGWFWPGEITPAEAVQPDTLPWDEGGNEYYRNASWKKQGVYPPFFKRVEQIDPRLERVLLNGVTNKSLLQQVIRGIDVEKSVGSDLDPAPWVQDMAANTPIDQIQLLFKEIDDLRARAGYLRPTTMRAWDNLLMQLAFPVFLAKSWACRQQMQQQQPSPQPQAPQTQTQPIENEQGPWAPVQSSAWEKQGENRTRFQVGDEVYYDLAKTYEKFKALYPNADVDPRERAELNSDMESLEEYREVPLTVVGFDHDYLMVVTPDGKDTSIPLDEVREADVQHPPTEWQRDIEDTPEQMQGLVTNASWKKADFYADENGRPQWQQSIWDADGQLQESVAISLIDKARELGSQAGAEAAHNVFQYRGTEYDSGPPTLDLSGEYADGETPRSIVEWVLHETRVDASPEQILQDDSYAFDDIVDAYEESYNAGALSVWEEGETVTPTTPAVPDTPEFRSDDWRKVPDSPEQMQSLVTNASWKKADLLRQIVDPNDDWSKPSNESDWIPQVGDSVLIKPGLTENWQWKTPPNPKFKEWVENYPEGKIVGVIPSSRPDGWPLFRVESEGREGDGLLLRQDQLTPLRYTGDDASTTPQVPDTLPEDWKLAWKKVADWSEGDDPDTDQIEICIRNDRRLSEEINRLVSQGADVEDIKQWGQKVVLRVSREMAEWMDDPEADLSDYIVDPAKIDWQRIWQDTADSLREDTMNSPVPDTLPSDWKLT